MFLISVKFMGRTFGKILITCVNVHFVKYSYHFSCKKWNGGKGHNLVIFNDKK